MVKGIYNLNKWNLEPYIRTSKILSKQSAPNDSVECYLIAQVHMKNKRKYSVNYDFFYLYELGTHIKMT